MKQKEFERMLTSEDIIDIKLMWENNVLFKFSLNYRASINDKWYEVYRVDNYHGFLHEQKFWRNPQPIRLKEEEQFPLRLVIKKYTDKITYNYKKYRKYFIRAKLK